MVLVLPELSVGVCSQLREVEGCLDLFGSVPKGRQSRLRAGAGDDYVDLAKIHRQR